MSHLEVAVGHIVVADEAQAVGPNSYGSVLTDVAWAVQGGEREFLTVMTGIFRSDTEGQPEAYKKRDPENEKRLSGHRDRPQVGPSPLVDCNSPKSSLHVNSFP